MLQNSQPASIPANREKCVKPSFMCPVLTEPHKPETLSVNNPIDTSLPVYISSREL